MPKHWLMIPLAMSFAGQAWAQDSFLCTGDITTGFNYNAGTGEWEAAHFRTDEKYVLKRKKETEWTVTMMGSSIGYPCQMQPGSTFIHCRGFLDFWMNTETMRFQRNSVVLGTIIKQKDGERPDSVFMQIGRCARTERSMCPYAPATISSAPILSASRSKTFCVTLKPAKGSIEIALHQSTLASQTPSGTPFRLAEILAHLAVVLVDHRRRDEPVSAPEVLHGLAGRDAGYLARAQLGGVATSCANAKQRLDGLSGRQTDHD